MLDFMKLRIIIFCLFLLLAGIGAVAMPFLLSESVSAAPSANLIAHWRFDEGNGTFIADSSGNGYHGTAVNTTWTSAAEAASLDPQALIFNGGDSYIDTEDFDINDDFTFSAWIKSNKNDDSAILMKHDDDGGNLIMIGLYSGKYFFRIRSESFYGPDVHTGDWIHIALTAYKEVAGPTNIERVSLFINGTYIDQYAMFTEVGDVSGRPWTIGQDWDGDTRTDFFDGAIDDVRIYDGELLPSEIKALSEDFSAICSIDPGGVPDLNYAGGSGVCDEVVLTAGTYEAANIEPAGDLLIRGNPVFTDTLISLGGTGVRRFISNSFYTVTLQDVTIRAGQLFGGGLGGALYNEATMHLQDVILTSNSSDGAGGALYNAGFLTVRDSTIEGNSGATGGGFSNGPGGIAVLENVSIENNAANGGGGILNFGTLTLTHSLVENNDSTASGGGILNFGLLSQSNTVISLNNAVGLGGGIFNDDFSGNIGTASIHTSQILTNTADQEGGGISNRGTLTLEHSTVSGNSAQNSGGGISNSQLAARIEIQDTTISANQAGGVGAGLESAAAALIENSTISGNQRTNPGDGAGVYSTAPLTLTHVTITDQNSTGTGTVNGLLIFGGPLLVHNTLLVDNGSGSINCAITGTTVTQAGNLSDDDTCTDFGEENSLVLLPLSDNGGPTFTHALPANSPARGAASSEHCLSVDQRGVPRGAPCDVGAYEFGALNLVYLPAVVR